MTNQKTSEMISMTPKTRMAKFISPKAGFGELGKKKKTVVMTV